MKLYKTAIVSLLIDLLLHCCTHPRTKKVGVRTRTYARTEYTVLYTHTFAHTLRIRKRIPPVVLCARTHTSAFLPEIWLCLCRSPFAVCRLLQQRHTHPTVTHTHRHAHRDRGGKLNDQIRILISVLPFSSVLVQLISGGHCTDKTASLLRQQNSTHYVH